MQEYEADNKTLSKVRAALVIKKRAWKLRSTCSFLYGKRSKMLPPIDRSRTLSI